MNSIVITPDTKYANKIKEALGTIMDLASENLLDERDAKEEPLKSVFDGQQKDMEVITRFYDSL